MSSKKQKPFVCVNFPADASGCNFWRMLAPRLTVQSIVKNINFTETSRFIADQEWFRDVNLIHMQRQVSNPQHEYFTKFIVPLSKQTGAWVCYNIDDALHMDDIPKYNSAWKAYQSERLMKNVKDMIQSADFLIVTTEYIKDYYVRKFGIEEFRVLIIPNYIPKWWMGQYYDIKKSVSNFEKYKKRPRIGITASGTHFDLKNNNNGVDDFTSIVNLIKRTTKKYEWVFMNTVPQQLVPELKAGKITCVPGGNVMNYPDAVGKMNCQVFVQPLIDCEFNRCKSPIKFLEAAALGTPLVAQRINIYEPYTDLLFDNEDELEKLLSKITSDKQLFIKIIKKQKRELDSGRNGKGWWLEDNISDWTKLYSMTKKCIAVDVVKAMEFIKSNTKQKEVDGLEIVR